jgi:hypothetical protein
MDAARAGINAFIRTYSNPVEDAKVNKWQTRKIAYDLRWQLYSNEAFEDLAKWRTYKAHHGLYRHIRSVYNPTRRLVDFYAGVVYPGTLTVDAKSLPSGSPIAIPISEDASPELLAAIAQAWKWSNWQSRKSLFVRYGAALGDVFVHIVDDLDSGRVYPEVLWPGMVSDIDVDCLGNLQMFTVEYEIYDEVEKKEYVYKKRVTPEVISTFKDDELFEYDDVPAEIENPYGFVPGIWCKHVDHGSDFGQPALRNASKIDELNQLVSMVLDNDRKILTAPVLVKGKGFSRMVTERTMKMPTDMLRNPELDQEGIHFVQGPADSDFKTLELPQGDAMLRIESLLKEVEADHPELGMYSKLRDMTQVTGPGVSRLFGDVQTYVDDAKSNYDTQTVKLFQMVVAIAGFRANSVAWGPLTKQQMSFVPFNLESYSRNELDFSILPRPLVPITESEQLQIEQQKLSMDTQRQQASGEHLTRMIGVMNGQETTPATRTAT